MTCMRSEASRATTDGTRRQLSVPRVDRGKLIARLRAPRPSPNEELAPQIFYVDAASLDKATWEALLPKLGAARAVIVDLRGGASPATFQILAHFTEREIASPYWDIPILEFHGISRYERRQLSILPIAPQLTSRLIFVTDGRTASASETILQYTRAARLGTIVGEATGGTNGDVATFDTVGGLRVRFTGLRAINQDGSPFHGIGITPDVVVHPTPDGLRAGRDELLETAIARGRD